MKIRSATASMLIGDQARTQNLLRENVGAADTAIAVERLTLVSSIINAPVATHQNYNVFVKIENTPEGMRTAQELISGLGQSAMTAPSKEEDPKSNRQPPVALIPTAGGMALGLAGGLGLGMAIEAVRTTANASGNPMLGNLAIGLGLLGTAIGGAAGATGTLPRFKYKDFELWFEKLS